MDVCMLPDRRLPVLPEHDPRTHVILEKAEVVAQGQANLPSIFANHHPHGFGTRFHRSRRSHRNSHVRHLQEHFCECC